MFLKFCVTNAIEQLIKMNGLNPDTITFFNRGAIDSFMPVIKQHQLDARQGAELIIFNTILQAAQSGDLIKLKEHKPDLYHNLESLWSFYTSLLIENEHKSKNVIPKSNSHGSFFAHDKQCA